jgi:rRNA maturation RNase YbeY
VPRSAISVLVTVEEPFSDSVDADRLRSIAIEVLRAERMVQAEVGVLVTADETVRRLNREYAGEDASTDVLAFSLQEGEEFIVPDRVERLGEVIISFPTAQRQAEEAGWGIDQEVAHLLVHGILHLLGYDHAVPEEEARMRTREETLLASAR